MSQSHLERRLDSRLDMAQDNVYTRLSILHNAINHLYSHREFTIQGDYRAILILQQAINSVVQDEIVHTETVTRQACRYAASHVQII